MLIGLIKNNTVRKILKSASIYTGGNFINKAMPIILVPILTRFLSPGEYGILATFVAILGIAQIVIYMGTTDAVIRSYFDTESAFKFPKYVFNAFVASFLVFAACTVSLFLFKNYFTKSVPLPFHCLLLIPAAGFFISIHTMSSRLLAMMKKAVSHSVFQVLSVTCEFILAILLVVSFRLGWEGRVASIVLSDFLFFAAAVVILIKNGFFSVSFNFSCIRVVFAYGFPVMLHSLGFVVIAAIDRFFLNKFLGLSVTGVYSVGYSVCSIIPFFTGAFTLALTPFIYERLKEATELTRIKIVRMTYLYFTFVLLGTLLFICLAPPILVVFVGEKFSSAKLYVFWLALGFGFHSMYTMMVSYIFYQKKTYILSIVAVITIILSLVLNYILIRTNGAIGAAQASFFVFLSRFLLVWYFSNKIYPLPWFSAVKLTVKKT